MRAYKERGRIDMDVDAEFERFFRASEPRLRRALVAAYGTNAGREATADALSWAWEHRDRLASMANPVGYLYRVGQSGAKPRKDRILHERTLWRDPSVEPALAASLARLPERQRVAVVLVCGYDWTLAEVADLLGLRVTTIQTHVERGLVGLRRDLEVDDDE